MNNIKKLYRSKTDRIIFGVCGGLAEYFQIDPLLVRAVFVLLALLNSLGVVAYFILAIIIPSDGEEARHKKAAESHKDREPMNWFLETKNIVGLLIILVGVNILFGQVFRFNPFAYINWGIIWSLIIILIGLKLVYKKY